MKGDGNQRRLSSQGHQTKIKCLFNEDPHIILMFQHGGKANLQSLVQASLVPCHYMA